MSNKHKFRWIIITGIAVLAVALGVFAFVRWGKPEPGQAEFKAYKADYKAGNLRSAIEHCRQAADQGNLKAQTLLGLFYGFLEKGDPALAVEYGAAHGALAMTTPGDTSMARLAEVEKLVGGGGARVDR